jgi:hypothetical protein
VGARAKSLSCRNPESPSPRAPRSSARGEARQAAGQRRKVIRGERRELRGRGRGLDVDDDLEPRRKVPAAPPEDLPNPAPKAVAHDGSPGSPAHGDPDAGILRVLAGEEKQLQMTSGHADPGGVALFEFSSLSKAVVPGESLPHNRTWAHTESLLRPLRRRAESTARPDRVRIRTRNPCVRLRRRLLGWYVRFIKRGHARGASRISQGKGRLKIAD